MDKIEKVANSVPNTFYDLIAYVVPSVIFVAALIVENIIDITFLESELSFIRNSWIYDIFFGFLGIAILYAIGVIIATLSYTFIKDPVVFLLKKVKIYEPEMSIGLATIMLEIQSKYNREIYSEMVKKHARVILLRNLTLTVFLIYIIRVIATGKFDNGAFYIPLFLIVLFAYFRRYRWFLGNVNKLKKLNI